MAPRATTRTALARTRPKDSRNLDSGQKAGAVKAGNRSERVRNRARGVPEAAEAGAVKAGKGSERARNRALSTSAEF